MAGVNFRKSKKVGPVRVTASKRGISTSVGVKGARVTKGADGRTRTTVGIPGTGISKTTTHSSPKTGPRTSGFGIVALIVIILKTTWVLTLGVTLWLTLAIAAGVAYLIPQLRGSASRLWKWGLRLLRPWSGSAPS